MASGYHKLGLGFGAWLMAVALMAAENTVQRWDYQGKNTPIPWNGITITATTALTPDHQPVLPVRCEYNRDELEWPSFLAYRISAAALDGVKKVKIFFYVKGPKNDVIGLRVTEHAPLSAHYSKTVEYRLTGDWQLVEYQETLFNEPGDRWANAPRLLLLKFHAGDDFYFGPLTLQSIK